MRSEFFRGHPFERSFSGFAVSCDTAQPKIDLFNDKGIVVETHAFNDLEEVVANKPFNGNTLVVRRHVDGGGELVDWSTAIGPVISNKSKEIMRRSIEQSGEGVLARKELYEKIYGNIPYVVFGKESDVELILPQERVVRIGDRNKEDKSNADPGIETAVREVTIPIMSRDVFPSDIKDPERLLVFSTFKFANHPINDIRERLHNQLQSGNFSESTIRSMLDIDFRVEQILE